MMQKVVSSLPFLAAATQASLVGHNWQIAGELMAAVPERSDMLDLLRDLSLMANSLADISDHDLIVRLMDNIEARFSPDVNAKFGLTEEEVDDLVIKYVPTRSGSLNKAKKNGIFDFTHILGGYGCWCGYGNGSPKHGHGQTVDGIDKLCKSLQQSYECIRMDSQSDTGIPFCDPLSADYNFNIAEFLLVTNSYPTNSISNNCKANNPGDLCAQETCEVELTMLADFKNGLYHDAPTSNYEPLTIDDQYKHPTFDAASECGTPGSSFPIFTHVPTGPGGYNPNNTGGTQATKKECCGVFPKRFPYNAGPENDPVRGCCLDKTYNLKNDCCQNDVISFGCLSP